MPPVYAVFHAALPECFHSCMVVVEKAVDAFVIAQRKVLRLTREIVEGERITCLMITHNMKNALELGSRTFMMDAGRVVLDIGGEERKGLTVDDLLERFRAGAGKNLDNDRILLSND